MIEYLEIRRIWDKAPHNAFTDLIRFGGQWYCAFRESSGHTVWDGNLRIIRSDDGVKWTSAAFIKCPESYKDLRDPKLSVTPEGELMLTAAAYKPTCQSMVWFSKDGTKWSNHYEVGPRGMWLWNTEWHGGVAYNFGRSESEHKFLQLYKSTDGKDFQPHGARQFDGIYANESASVFMEDGTCVTLLRCDGDHPNAQLGTSKPPYEKWAWADLEVHIGGPELIQLPDGRFLAGVRLYDNKARTALCWVDISAGTISEFVTMPSGGDTSYAGMVWHDDMLWFSYYSTVDFSSDMTKTVNERGKTAIYLARAQFVNN